MGTVSFHGLGPQGNAHVTSLLPERNLIREMGIVEPAVLPAEKTEIIFVDIPEIAQMSGAGAIADFDFAIRKSMGRFE